MSEVIDTTRVFVLLGPPGAGKGTQARTLEQTFGLKQLSTGDLLRNAAAAGTPAGLAAKPVMDRGALVSDDIVIAVLQERIAAPDVGSGAVLDGFPRTVTQAEALDRMLTAERGILAAAISLEVVEAAMISRIVGRFTCASCGEGYHDDFKKPVRAGCCDRCGGTAFARRADDTAETIRSRLDAYRAETAPVTDYYARKGVLRRVDAMGAIADIRKDLSRIIADATH